MRVFPIGSDPFRQSARTENPCVDSSILSLPTKQAFKHSGVFNVLAAIKLAEDARDHQADHHRGRTLLNPRLRPCCRRHRASSLALRGNRFPSVNAIRLCPSSSMIALRCMPLASSRLAAECRRSWRSGWSVGKPFSRPS